MEISKDIKYIGVDDHDIDLFEGMYAVPRGMAYNSYVILDEKIAVMDTVEARFGEKWLANLENELGGRKPDFLVVQHMEPDHSANIAVFAEKYPEAKIVASAKAFTMMGQFYGSDFKEKQVVVGEGGKLSLGAHELCFITAPMVHWPEVIMTYDSADKALFTADGFGKFGANDIVDPEGWACEARRYYFGIVGKFGAQVQAVLKKAKALDVEKILPLHGPALTENLEYYLDLYNIWSSYGVESEGVCVAYTSVYGHTKEAALLLAEKLEKAGCKKVALTDLARDDWAEAVEDAFRYGKLVLATTTYNGDIFPIMREFIAHLTERNYQNRFIGIIENGSWAATAAKLIKKSFENSKNITFAEAAVSLKSALAPANEEQLDALCAELMK